MSFYKTTILSTEHCVSHCITCGVLYTVPANLWDEQQKMGGMHYCCNGHQQGWNKGGSEFEKLKRERDRLAQQIAQKDDEIADEHRKRIKAEKLAKRQEKRIRAGVCIECHRHFTNLENHMATKHPQGEHHAKDTTRHHRGAANGAEKQ